MNDLNQTGSQIVEFLVPYPPYIIKGAKVAGQEAAKKLGEKFSEDCFKQAKALWRHLGHKKNVQAAGQAVIALPDNQAIQAGLSDEMTHALQEDDILAQKIAYIWGHGDKPDVSSGQRAVTAKNISGIIITGDSNKVIQSK